MDNKKNIPEIRFPEFKNEGEWEKKKLSQVGNLVNGLTYSPNDVSSAGVLVLRSSNIKKNKLSLEDNVYVNLKINEANLSKIGDILICVRNGSKSLIGKNALIKETLPKTTHGAFMTVFRSDNYGFISQLFQSDLFFQQVHADLGATINSINGKNLLNYQFDLPTNPKEQQKIADCLLSLDEVIEAQEEKLKALKLHKKGLMQNLFPQEGETVPKYRFPEFQNDGDWVEKELSEVGRLVNGLIYSPDDINDKGTLVLRSSNIKNSRLVFIDNVYVSMMINSDNLTKIGDILICIRNGSKSLIGKNALVKENLTETTHGAFMTIFRSQNYNFVYQLFQSDSYFKQVHADLGATINSINGKNLLKYKFYFPTNIAEQQKIATGLSCLDDLITEQQNEIDRLKLHKKGLMQVLFPQTN